MIQPTAALRTTTPGHAAAGAGAGDGAAFGLSMLAIGGGGVDAMVVDPAAPVAPVANVTPVAAGTTGNLLPGQAAIAAAVDPALAWLPAVNIAVPAPMAVMPAAASVSVVPGPAAVAPLAIAPAKGAAPAAMLPAPAVPIATVPIRAADAGPPAPAPAVPSPTDAIVQAPATTAGDAPSGTSDAETATPVAIDPSPLPTTTPVPVVVTADPRPIRPAPVATIVRASVSASAIAVALPTPAPAPVAADDPAKPDTPVAVATPRGETPPAKTARKTLDVPRRTSAQPGAPRRAGVIGDATRTPDDRLPAAPEGDPARQDEPAAQDNAAPLSVLTPVPTPTTAAPRPPVDAAPPGANTMVVASDRQAPDASPRPHHDAGARATGAAVRQRAAAATVSHPAEAAVAEGEPQEPAQAPAAAAPSQMAEIVPPTPLPGADVPAAPPTTASAAAPAAPNRIRDRAMPPAAAIAPMEATGTPAPRTASAPAAPTARRPDAPETDAVPAMASLRADSIAAPAMAVAMPPAALDAPVTTPVAPPTPATPHTETPRNVPVQRTDPATIPVTAAAPATIASASRDAAMPMIVHAAQPQAVAGSRDGRAAPIRRGTSPIPAAAPTTHAVDSAVAIPQDAMPSRAPIATRDIAPAAAADIPTATIPTPPRATPAPTQSADIPVLTPAAVTPTAPAAPTTQATAAPQALAGTAAVPVDGPTQSAVPAPEPRRAAFVREIAGTRVQAVALAPVAQPAPLPAAGLTAPAAQVFGAAIHAAQIREEAPAPDAAMPAAATLVQTATPALATDAGRPILDMRQDRWPGAMIDHIETLRDAADANSTRIRLVPDALGTIDIALRRDGDTLHVHFTADQAATRSLLQEAQPRLAQAAEDRGIRLGDTAVTAGSGASNDPSRDPSDQPHNQSDPARQAESRAASDQPRNASAQAGEGQHQRQPPRQPQSGTLPNRAAPRAPTPDEAQAAAAGRLA